MRTLLSLLILLATVACGDDDAPAGDAGAAADGPSGGADAGVDAPPAIDAAPSDANLAACPATYGPSSVVNTFVMQSDEAGAFDLDGDGTGDNALGGVAALANMDFMNDLADGDFRVVTELRELDDATLQDDAALVLFVTPGVDTDDPAAPADDFSHMEPFYFDVAAVNPGDCSPKALVAASLAGGTVTGMADVLPLPIPGFGVLPVGRPRLEFSIAPDAAGAGFATTANGRIGGVFPTCPLNSDPAPLGQNSLHAVTLLGLAPDIDMDEDGLETIQADSAGIISCTDGDGTVIDGELCGCDPRIADGFSTYIHFTSVGATLVGPAPGP